jgi:hypothetical protein
MERKKSKKEEDEKKNPAIGVSGFRLVYFKFLCLSLI